MTRKKGIPRAIQLLQESAQKKSLDADSLFYLAMSQLQARQRTEARGALNEALTELTDLVITTLAQTSGVLTRSGAIAKLLGSLVLWSFSRSLHHCTSDSLTMIPD